MGTRASMRLPIKERGKCWQLGPLRCYQQQHEPSLGIATTRCLERLDYEWVGEVRFVSRQFQALNRDMRG